jgi:hypothetical protein
MMPRVTSDVREWIQKSAVTGRSPELPQHPIGTLAIVGVYGVLFALGWLLFYFYVYLPRGSVTP